MINLCYHGTGSALSSERGKHCKRGKSSMSSKHGKRSESKQSSNHGKRSENRKEIKSEMKYTRL